MPRYIPPSVNDVGLKQHLNNTANMHDGNDFDMFEKLVRSATPKAVIARIFNVSRPTVVEWLRHYNAEAVDGDK